MPKWLLLITILLSMAPAFHKELPAADVNPVPLETAAERSNYEKTSTYAEVMDFLFEAQKRSDKINIIRFATSTEGRMIPLVIISNEGIKSPNELKLTTKPTVLFMANIHAGEIEGKEALQMLIREVVSGQCGDILDNQVILALPIFNADGNDKFGKNRRDNGPALAGVRFNGQQLDLNRDAVKLESPEMRALIKLFNEWDPVLVVDMHTTNGSYHREPVTYSPLLSPNSDPQLVDYMWQKFFPIVTEALKKKYGYDSVPYGNFIDREFPEKGWESEAYAARYVTNYVGMRNRFSILDENYSYADFKTRVLASFSFVKAILNYTHQNIRSMQQMVMTADNKTKSDFFKGNFALEYKVEKLMSLTIKSYVFEKEVIKPEDRDKYPPWIKDFIIKKTDVLKDYKVDYFAKPVPTRGISLPEAYIILPYHDEVIQTLKNHGIIVEKIRKTIQTKAENFVIEKLELATELFQGHVFLTVKGHFDSVEVSIPENSYFVSMRQPLARLIPTMLEPESEDSLIAWGFFNREIVAQWTGRLNLYPVYRLNKLDIPIERYQE
ncbi:MAG: hypothetical protein QG657_4692 [Acidobacteriota bacterium]|nr:hypothetical protein [Acidobacteriota bacterium]